MVGTPAACGTHACRYLRWLGFTTPAVELDILGRPRLESSSSASGVAALFASASTTATLTSQSIQSSSSAGSSGSSSGPGGLLGALVSRARSGSGSSGGDRGDRSGTHAGRKDSSTAIDTSMAHEFSTGDDGAGLGAEAVLDAEGRDCVDRFEYHFHRAAVTGMPAKMMELVYHGIPPCFRQRVCVRACTCVHTC